MIHALLPCLPQPQPRLYSFNACAEPEHPAKPEQPELSLVKSDRERERAAAEMEFAPYRRQTIRLLHRYFRTSLEIGRLPGILGREFFRSRVSSRKACTFEDEVIFATDLDRCVARLDPTREIPGRRSRTAGIRSGANGADDRLDPQVGTISLLPCAR